MTEQNYSNSPKPNPVAMPVSSQSYKRDHGGWPYMDPEEVVQNKERPSDFPDLASRAEHPDQLRFL